nr:ribosomal protein S14 [Ostreobium quekettii]
MSRKSLIEREKKRKNLVQKFLKKRQYLKSQIKQSVFLEEKFNVHIKIQQLPRNSAPTRLHRRCILSGRPKGFYRDFGVSRHFIRELAHEGFLPGVQKASW